MSNGPQTITDFERRVVLAVREVVKGYADFLPSQITAIQQGRWVTSAQVHAVIDAESIEVRQALESLSSRMITERTKFGDVTVFRLSSKGHDLIIDRPEGREEDSSSFPLEVSGASLSETEVSKIISILSQMEDVAEGEKNNSERAQIYGLIKAVRALIDLPEPPRRGLLALLSDPVFGNLVQIAALAAAIIAVVKS